MKDEQLDEAIRALRETFPGTSAGAWRTELRIVEGLEGRQHRTLRWRWGLPLLAVCLGSTAWAANQSEVTATLRSWFVPRPTLIVATAPTARKLPSLPSKPPAVEVVTNPVPPTEMRPVAPETSAVLPQSHSTSAVLPQSHSTSAVLPQSTSPSPSPSVRSIVLPQAHPTSPSPSVNGATPTTETTAPLVHYRVAQRFQFEQNDCVNAVKSWEAYLVAEPRGPLVLDARYHRAECLFKLGRSAEARAALKPFADGEYGSYRRDAARKLLEQP